jgi:hypothetical protein
MPSATPSTSEETIVLEFIFMLTKDDQTIPDALDVYEGLRETGLRYVGFKDVGVPTETLRQLTEAIRKDGRTVVLEVVSLSTDDEVRSVRAGLELGVDIVMGGTHPEAVLPLLSGSSVRYLPFPGKVIDHPSVLTGSIEEIADHSRDLTSLPGVHGLDLLAYRHAGDVPTLMTAVVVASSGPVVVAGSIDSDERIEAVRSSGAWAFTVGGAVFDRSFVPGGSYEEQVRHILARAASPS